MTSSPSRDSRVAAPADDGGHQGSYTVPEDVQLRSDAPPEAPSTNQDANPPIADRPGGRSWWIVLGVLFVLVMLGYWARFV